MRGEVGAAGSDGRVDGRFEGENDAVIVGRTDINGKVDGRVDWKFDGKVDWILDWKVDGRVDPNLEGDVDVILSYSSQPKRNVTIFQRKVKLILSFISACFVVRV